MIEINGVKYKRREEPRMNTGMSFLMLCAYMSVNMFDPVKKSVGEKDDFDIVKEYALIMQKKSRLSKSKREHVVYQFKRKYEAI